MKTTTYDETKWQLVPIEPTSEMLVRGGEEFFDSARNWKIGSTLRDQDHASMIYEGMLAVAAALPETKVQAASEGPAYGIIDPDYARAYTIIRCTAWQYGYATGMHGSFTRDLDLILVPWAETGCASPERLLKLIAERTGTTIQHSSPSAKPHGRQAWSLLFPDFGDPRWIDISVMPVSIPTSVASEDRK